MKNRKYSGSKYIAQVNLSSKASFARRRAFQASPLFLAALLGFACQKSPQTAGPEGEPANPPSSSPAAQTPQPSGEAASTAPAHDQAARETILPCPALRCTSHPEPAAALVTIARSKARVIAFGEAHARADFKGKTTVARFSEEILPALAPHSSHLLVELLIPPGGCEEAREAAQKESDQITQGQKKENKNEYVALGNKSRELGVVPDILRASCQDMEAIQDAGDLAVVAMMETIASLSVESAKKMLAESKDGRPLLLMYGGALHNDVEPRENFATWSYASDLIEHTSGAYAEVDLIVPELVQSTESWKQFAWYESYLGLPDDHDTVLIQTGDKSYALVFPKAAPSQEQAAPSEEQAAQ